MPVLAGARSRRVDPKRLILLPPMVGAKPQAAGISVHASIGGAQVVVYLG